jgi:hypothetical protein
VYKPWVSLNGGCLGTLLWIRRWLGPPANRPHTACQPYQQPVINDRTILSLHHKSHTLLGTPPLLTPAPLSPQGEGYPQ